MKKRKSPTKRSTAKRYELIVGNIGKVWEGSDQTKANDMFISYKNASLYGHGRAGRENVDLFLNGDVVRQFIGTIEEHES